MKKITYLLFAVAMTAILTTGCGSKTNPMITKKWSFKELDKADMEALVSKMVAPQKEIIDKLGESELKESMKAKMEETIGEAQAEVNKQFKDWTFNFKSDGICEGTGAGMKGGRNAKWELSEDTKKLTLTDDKNQMVCDVVKLTDTELSIKFKLAEAAVTLNFEPAK